MRLITFSVLTILVATNAYSVEKSRIRFNLGMAGNVNEFTEKYDNTEFNYNDSDNYSVRTGNIKIYYVFENGLNLGWNQGMVFAETPSESDKISISNGGIILGYTFGESFNLSTGVCVFCLTLLTDYTKNNREYEVESKSSSATSYYLDIGFELSDKWELLLGYNFYEGRVKSKIENNSNNYSHNFSCTTYDIGVGYKF